MRRDWQDLNKRLRRELEVTQDWISKQTSQLIDKSDFNVNWFSYENLEGWKCSLSQALQKLSKERVLKPHWPPKLYWLNKEMTLQEKILECKAFYEMGNAYQQFIVQKILKIQQTLPKAVLDEVALEESQSLVVEEELKDKSLQNYLKWNEAEISHTKLNNIEEEILRSEVALNTLEASRSVAHEFEFTNKILNKAPSFRKQIRHFGVEGIVITKKIKNILLREEIKLLSKLKEMKEALLLISDPARLKNMDVVTVSDHLYKTKKNFEECEKIFTKLNEDYKKIFLSC